MRAGEVAIINFPYVEGTGSKTRPGLIVGVGPRDRGDEAVVVAMITSNARRVSSPGPGDILIPEWSTVPLAQPSVVRARRFQSVERKNLGRIVGQVDNRTLAAVRAEIRKLLT